MKTKETPETDQWISPVTIFDAQGQVVQVIPGLEFRRRARAHTDATTPERAGNSRVFVHR